MGLNLVTGATGIIGSHVVLALLRDGEQVIATRRQSSDTSKTLQLFNYYENERASALFSQIQWTELDLNDIFALEELVGKVGVVYHCSGLVSFSRYDYRRLMEVNEAHTRNIVNACLNSGTSLCHVSSVATLHNLDYLLPLHESVYWKKSGKESAYAISKYNAEREVWRGIEEGLKAVIVNPGVVLSPGFWTQSSSQLFQNIAGGNSFFAPGKTGYISANDVAKVMVYLVRQSFFGERVILIENNYSYKEIFSLIQVKLGLKPPTKAITQTMLRLAWMMDSLRAFFTGKKPVLFKANIHSAFNEQLYSNEKLKKVYPLALTPVPTVIDQICSFYRSESKI